MVVTADLTTPISQRDRSNRLKISEQIRELNEMCAQMDLKLAQSIAHNNIKIHILLSCIC